MENISTALELYFDLGYNHGVWQVDFKGNNVMFDERKREYIIDFGLAVQELGDSVHSHMLHVTKTFFKNITYYGDKQELGFGPCFLLDLNLDSRRRVYFDVLIACLGFLKSAGLLEEWGSKKKKSKKKDRSGGAGTNSVGWEDDYEWKIVIPRKIPLFLKAKLLKIEELIEGTSLKFVYIDEEKEYINLSKKVEAYFKNPKVQTKKKDKIYEKLKSVINDYFSTL
jgi:hypothetical protein